MGKLADGGYDYCYVTLDVEYLPGKKRKVILSPGYASDDVSEASLRHVQKTHPEAGIYACQEFQTEGSEEFEDYQERLNKLKKSDEYYRELFLTNSSEERSNEVVDEHA